MGTSYEEFQASNVAPNVAPGFTCVLYNNGEQLEASKSGSVYFPVSTPRFPEQFGGSFARLVSYCQVTPRPLTIQITDNFNVPDDGGTPWDFGSLNGDLTLDCGDVPRQIQFDENAQIRFENIGALLGFSSIQNNATVRGGFVSNSGTTTTMVIDGKSQTTTLDVTDNGPALFNVTNNGVPNIVLRNVQAVEASSYNTPPTFRADLSINFGLDQGVDIQPGTIEVPGVITANLKSNYDVRNFSTDQVVTSMTVSSNTLDTTYVTTDALIILPTWKEIFIDSSSVGKIFLPLYPYDGQWFCITDAVNGTDFSGNPVNLEQGVTTALIQEFSGPTSFNTFVKLDRKGQSITYVYNATLNKWHVRANFQ